MSSEAGLYLGAASIGITLASSMVFGVIRWLSGHKDRDQERRMATYDEAIKSASQQHAATAERLRIDELATTKLQGEVNLVAHTIKGFDRDLDEIKKHQVPRAEWETRMSGLESVLQRVLTKIDEAAQRGRSGGYPGAYGRGAEPPSK